MEGEGGDGRGEGEWREKGDRDTGKELRWEGGGNGVKEESMIYSFFIL